VVTCLFLTFASTFDRSMKGFIANYMPRYRSLLFLGVPIILGQLGVIVMGFADTLMIGRHGTDELAASAFVNTIFNLVLIFSAGFASGITPVIGALFGRGDNRGVGAVLRDSLAANVIVAFLSMLVMLAIYPFLSYMGQPVELLPYARPYYLIQVASLPFILLFYGYKQFADGITDTRTGMWILLGSNVLNIIFNYILIYGKCGMPELGLTGAGISTLVSRISMCAVFAFIFHRTGRYKPFREGFSASRVSREGMGRLYSLGLPLGIQTALESSAWSLSAIMIGWLGAIPLAAYQITVTLGNIGYMAYLGMGSAVAVEVSRYTGASQFGEVRAMVTAGAHLLFAQACLTGVLLFLLRNFIPSWFTDDVEVVAVVQTLVIPLIIYQFADAIQINYANALRGLADVRALMFISLAAFYLLALPVAYLCGFTLSMGVVGVWMGFPVGLFTVAVLFRWRFGVCLRRIERENTIV